MHSYIIHTKYAAEVLFEAIFAEKKALDKAQAEHKAILDRMHHHATRLKSTNLTTTQFDSDGNELTHLAEYEINDTLESMHNANDLEAEIEATIDARQNARLALCGAVLQIAKQGISTVHNGLSACPNGRSIGGETLKNIIFQGRNQSMHYEENNYSNAVIGCFRALENSFGEQFSLTNYPTKNMAGEILNILGWEDYAHYEKDMFLLSG